MDKTKMYLKISAGEEEFYFTQAEGLQLLKEETDRIARERRGDEMPYTVDFEFMTPEDFAELSDNPDRPSLTPPVAEERTFTLAEAMEIWAAGYSAGAWSEFGKNPEAKHDYFLKAFNITLPE